MLFFQLMSFFLAIVVGFLGFRYLKAKMLLKEFVDIVSAQNAQIDMLSQQIVERREQLANEQANRRTAMQASAQPRMYTQAECNAWLQDALDVAQTWREKYRKVVMQHDPIKLNEYVNAGRGRRRITFGPKAKVTNAT